MKVYHFSDFPYKEGDYIPVGNFGKTIRTSSQIVQDFEDLMESKRKQHPNSSISRLNCLFTFPPSEAEGFKTSRKYLYELDLPEDVHRESRNHEVGSYFSYLFPSGNWSLVMLDVKLMDDYWAKPNTYVNYANKIIKNREEILVAEPLLVLRVILLH